MSPGTRLGPYEILAPLGAGGMGEVYRARDAKLNRDVALKILPDTFATDADRVARFRREAQVLASLNHPHIGHIYGFEDSGATHALVLELVEGPTLADRIAAGPMPLADALPIAKQIAEALEAAHEQGIVHRDLKPANVKIRDDGTVKVLDFGLAKALDPPTGVRPEAMNSPTLTARATQMGLIIGTAAYMAPEQAKGKAVDKRADIWAFGAVLYEMLSGLRAFQGEDISDTLAAVLKQTPSFEALPPSTPPRLTRLLERCLERDPKQRLRDIGEARLEIAKIEAGPPDASVVSVPVVPPAAANRPKRSLLPWAVAAMLGIALVTALVLWSPWTSAPRAPRIVTRAELSLKEFSAFVSLSRDGTRLAYSTLGGTNNAFLTLRMMDQFQGKPVPGSDGALFPMFSPDGQWIAYATTEQPAKIKKISVTGGTAITLSDGNFAAGSAWGDDDTIVFGGANGLMRVSARGGTPQTLTTVDGAKGEAAHTRPQFLPGGKLLLFTVVPVNSEAGTKFAVLDFAKGAYHTVAKGGVNGRYAASGHLTYLTGATLFAVPFDLGRLVVLGDEVPVIEGVSMTGPPGTGDYTFSDEGQLVYVVGDAEGGTTTLAWANRKGTTEILPGQARQNWGTGRASPDGRRIANSISRDKMGTDIWILDAQRGTTTRLTFGGDNTRPIWTPDGSRIVYTATKDGKSGLFAVPADGSGKPELLLATDTPGNPSSFTPDGKTLLYDQIVDKRRQVYVVDLSSRVRPGAPRPLHHATGAELSAQVSPDGRWVAYQSNESGTWEIYVQPFPGPGPKVRISTEGGQSPRWSRHGRELLYWANNPTSRLTAVAIPPGPVLNPGAPNQVFQLLSGTTWDVTPDPDRLLVELTSDRSGTKIATVTDWFEELRRRAPVKK
jgi:Tol biopolymer transport system component